MTLAAPMAPDITAVDRLGLTLFLAITIHVLIILGLTFRPDPPHAAPPVPVLEITLVQPHEEEAVDKARLLAQASQAGGGDSPLAGRSASPLSAHRHVPLAVQAVPRLSRKIPERHHADAELLMTTVQPVPHQVNAVPQIYRKQPVELPANADQLVAQSIEIARLSAEISRSFDDYAQRERHHYLSARTQSIRDAIYLDAWRVKIEQIGNLNYPDEAKRLNITGDLILDVALEPDGHLRGITLRHSSGKKVLDDAAMRIVRLAAPFAPFTPAMRKDFDVLHIVRTWRFLDGNHLRAGGN